MKFLVSVILMAILGLALSLLLPWWSIAIACFVVALLIPLPPFDAFLCGLAAMALHWGGLALYISSNNDHILAAKMSMLLLKSENPYLPVVVAAMLGGFIGALASLSASWLRFSKKMKN